MSKKKSNKMKQTWILLGVLVLIVIAIGVCVLVMFKKNNGSFFGNKSESSSAEDGEKGYLEVTDVADLENIEIEVKESEDYVEPASGTLEIEKIQGFTGNTTGASAESETAGEENDLESTEEITSGITLSDPDLVVEDIGRYAGNFLEDGSDEPTANVAAMLITNNSDQMLQIAEITFQVNDTETANFKVTNLPAGTTTLVLESNKREFKEEDSYIYGDSATAYMEQPTLEEDKFELVTEKGKIILKNKTDQSYEKVYVYYKYVQLGGAYLGGITYRTPFENVPAQGEVESVASHFNPNSSQIMAVQIQE